jgi:SAM-dependent methyltransferase
VLSERGWSVHAIEPSEAARAALARALGAEALVGRTLADAALAPASFELVTLFDVLEHLPDPLAALSRARELLAPGGRLVIETQNVASGAARLLGRRWHHYKHAEHLLHFSPATLAHALERAGLESVVALRRGGGKYVGRDFLVERSARLAPWLPRVARPLSRLLPRTLWVDPRDELLVVARARA